MRIASLLIFTTGIGLACGESAAPAALITSGPVTVTSDDFEAFMLRVPEVNRPEARSSYEWIGKATDLIYENRVLALEARRKGYDKDPRIALRMKQVEESFLAQVWTDRYRKEFRQPDLSLRAQELYRVNRDKFTEPESVSGYQIVISLEGRTREMAKSIAQDIYEKAHAGANFAELATQFSDDPSARRNQGRFDRIKRSGFIEPVSDAVFALKSPGDITPPIESRYGYHVAKLEKKEPARVKPFKEVEEAIIGEEADRLRNASLETELGRLKDLSNTVVNTKNIEALRVEIDRSLIERAHREVLKSPSMTVPAPQ